MLGVTQHGLKLFSSYAGKPFEEVIHTGAVFEFANRAWTGTRVPTKWLDAAEGSEFVVAALEFARQRQ